MEVRMRMHMLQACQLASQARTHLRDLLKKNEAASSEGRDDGSSAPASAPAAAEMPRRDFRVADAMSSGRAESSTDAVALSVVARPPSGGGAAEFATSSRSFESVAAPLASLPQPTPCAEAAED